MFQKIVKKFQKIVKKLIVFFNSDALIELFLFIGDKIAAATESTEIDDLAVDLARKAFHMKQKGETFNEILVNIGLDCINDLVNRPDNKLDAIDEGTICKILKDRGLLK